MSDKEVKKNGKGEKQPIFTKETLGVVIALFSTLCLVCLITRDKVFSTPGQVVNAFFLGLFGWFSYAVLALSLVISVMTVFDKKFNLSKKQTAKIILASVCFAIFCHSLNMGSVSNYSGFGDYLALSYSLGAGGISSSSAGGIITALMAYPLSALLSSVGASVVCALVTAYLVYTIVKPYFDKNGKANETKEKFRSSYVPQEENLKIEGEREYPVAFEEVKSNPTQKLFVNNANDFAFKTKREKANETEENLIINSSASGLGVADFNKTYSQGYSDEIQKKIDYIKTPAKIDLQSTLSNTQPAQTESAGTGTTVSDYISRKSEPSSYDIPHFEHENITENTEAKATISEDASLSAQNFAEKYAGAEEIDMGDDYSEPQETFIPLENFESEEKISQVEITSEETPTLEDYEEAFSIENYEEEIIEEPIKEEPKEYFEIEKPAPSVIRERRTRDIFFEEPKEQPKENTFDAFEKAYDSRVIKDGNAEEEIEVFEEEKPAKEIPPINREYFRPPLDLLETYTLPVNAEQENHEERKQIIKQTLADFHINAEPQGHIQGPSITRYEIMMPAGITVKRVLNYDNDLRMRLASKDGVRIEAPIPGKNLVGIEVANKHKVTVGLREIMEDTASKPSKPGSLIFAIGKDLVGNAVTDDLAKGPHYLVAGSTGSGKSVCLNLMIVSMIMRYTPEELRLILVDPKGVEFRPYEHIPHLMIDEIISEPRKALAVLQWAYDEMERRYKQFQDHEGVVDIDAYNEVVASDTVAKMPRIVIVVDELSNLMETCKKEMDARILAIAQKARAAGIHLVLATQRPSVDVITGTIKANLPSRIALKLMSFADSNTIISEGGAEKLLGNGDMLYRNSGMSECERYQGAYISRREVNNVVKYIKENNKAYFDDELTEFLEKAVRPKQEETAVESTDDGGESGENVELFKKALWLAVNSGTIAISQLQRRFQIGYARAGGLVDKMERMGYISGNEGSRARRVLLSIEEFEEKYGTMTDNF